MKATIIVPDKTVVVSGVAHEIPELDWSVFEGDPSTPWDDIRAVQISGETGHIEFKTISTQPAHRPDIMPGNQIITRDEFLSRFGFAVEAWTAAEAKAQQEREAVSAAAAERAEAAPQDIAPVVDAATRSELEALKEQFSVLDGQHTELLKKLAEGGA